MRFLFALLLSLSQSYLFAGDLIHLPDSKISFQEKLQWAHSAATQSSYWVGYSISRYAYDNENFMSGVTINGDFRMDRTKPTLQEWVHGIKIPQKRELKDAAQSELDRLDHKKHERVSKDVGIFQKFEHGKRTPVRISVIDMNLPYNFDATLYWLGSVEQEESFEYISRQYAETQRNNDKEDLMATISIHPENLAFPFFKKILTGKEPQEVQESAAIFTGEIGTPEALALLKEVARSNPYKDVREGAIVGISEMDSPESLKFLSEVAISHTDKDLRETAMAMLSDKHDPVAFDALRKVAWFDADSDMRETAVVMLSEKEEGVPILLQIMEDHPSKETREIAVHMLAETIAGREILKKKVKN